MAQQGNSVVPMGLCLENYPILSGQFCLYAEDTAPGIENGVHGCAAAESERSDGSPVAWKEFQRRLLGSYREGTGRQRIPGDRAGSDRIREIFQAGYASVYISTIGGRDQSRAGQRGSGQSGGTCSFHGRDGFGTRFVLSYPDRVEKFILEDPIGLEDWKLKVPYPGMDAWYEQELNQNYDSLKKYELESYYHGTWSPAYDEWLNIYAGWMLSPEYSRIAWNSALTYDMIFTQPVCYEFGGIWAPSMLIVGKLDRTALGKNLVPASVAQTMGNYPEHGGLPPQRSRIADWWKWKG